MTKEPIENKGTGLLKDAFPEIEKQWDFKKNTIGLDEVKVKSNKKAWWVCDRGHSWETRVTYRTSSGKLSSCPYCANRKVLPGFNDLATTHPSLAKQWDFKKNSGLSPQDIVAGSNKNFWWICSLGHSWRATGNDRVSAGTGCPYCANKKVLSGFNDIATMHPEIAEQWDHEKNGDVTPACVIAGSGRKAWWICNKGHSWEARVADRKRFGCPYCTNVKLLKGYNDLKTAHPEIAKQWDTKKNKLSPSEVMAGSNKSFWWLCDRGHSWEVSPKNRAQGRGCPYCSGRRVDSGVNDLVTTHPDLVEKYWDFVKNKGLSPQSVSQGSDKKVWWICDKGHSHQIDVHSKTNGYNCPYCYGRRVLRGYNDMATTYPKSLEMWDWESNTLTPYEVTKHSNKTVSWKCQEGHQWKTQCYHIAQGGRCPECYGRVSVKESEAREFVASIVPEGVVVDRGRRDIIAPYELDVYIPELKIAIEYNGVYWHSEACNEDSKYHEMKWEMCRDQDVQLITVWEDDWILSQDVVKNMLKTRLGVGRVNSSVELKPHKVDKGTAKIFCTKYHIQGFSPGSAYIGLKDKGAGELVALSIWRKNKDELHLVKYCSKGSVTGGLKTLLGSGIDLAKKLGCNQIVTIVQHDFEDENAYLSLGFTKDRELGPDYSYFDRKGRIPRENYPKRRFRDDPDLLFEPGLTLAQLAKLNDMNRVWDSGRTKYVFQL